ncbi:magnesium/cobalt transporter CorA [SCandidatus Aminicenantes bacterium Aminicenantia_JdfR_composite]|jgi:magnesium transporter|nr:magnesium/cobalt transporter CorA [SCandidatus Aminicenantes bacterium Aminicenantia_JdfR_composite]MCP2596279.1 magnesium/cobalt transporter CorA [Candidatus Aminicenantes bacterium AC-335-G13]MCP2597854.1 magnesium/cobalt transporter CorA [Candidatus Aminicenantes bacterium AC-335-L06]MCP2605607.1 magnesium/cobalt transporter CorA [Candidatus Aminicenantes bacterium AC-335-O07]MCP2620489.1 magnesium/cobalt transporter CorA [Candidatus Aminicenantes bacterium AC-334-E05]
MKKIIKGRSKKIGLPPGTLVHIGDKKMDKVKIIVVEYNKSQYNEREVENIEKIFPIKGKNTTTWVNITGISQIKIVEEIGRRLDLHPLILEDIVNTDQRSKVESFEDYIFIVLKIPFYEEQSSEIRIEQVSFVLGSNFVISFQEIENPIFNPIKERIRNPKSFIRKNGADYLAYCLIDVIIDNHFSIIENLEKDIENIEENLLINPSKETLQNIHKLKREIIFLRNSVWPLREVINNLERAESKLIKKTTGIYLRDAYDHTIQVIESIETLREMITGMLDVYLSSVSNQLNKIMMLLTVIGTIFIPLTFITGIYGMNFKYMPELYWKWSYPLVLLIMLIIGALMLVYFKRKKWF